MSEDRQSSGRNRWLYSLGAGHFLMHVLTSARYGVFRDELYYLACARRLDWGYVDHPPLSIAMLAINRWIGGESILALRMVPALCGAATVILTGLIARELGGGKLAQCLSALAVALGPIYLIMFDFFSLNAFELLIWSALSLVLIRMLKNREPRLWLCVGALLGAGLLNKHTTAILGPALLVGLFLTPERRHLRGKWIWLGAFVAFLFILPNLIWQQVHGWPSLEFYRNAVLEKNIDTGPGMALFMQFFVLGPAAFPLVLAGVYFYLFAERGRSYRSLGWAYLVLLGLFLLSRSSRPDRLAGIYPLILAAGAVVIERASERAAWRWVRVALPSLVLVLGLALAPISTTLLPPEVTTRYMGLFGRLLQIERGKSASLPQWLADRMGWEELAVTVGKIVSALPEEDRRRAVLYGDNYGEAGAMEYYAVRYNLPPVISTHNSYHLWGFQQKEVDVLIAVGADPEDLRRLFESVERVGATRCEYCMDYENGVPIYLAKGPKVTIQDFWEQFKDYE